MNFVRDPDPLEAILLILQKNICCDPSSEPSRQDDSDEWSQHMVLMRNKKNYLELSSNSPSYLELLISY